MSNAASQVFILKDEAKVEFYHPQICSKVPKTTDGDAEISSIVAQQESLKLSSPNMEVCFFDVFNLVIHIVCVEVVNDDTTQ